jgi:hypothetical protein
LHRSGVLALRRGPRSLVGLPASSEFDAPSHRFDEILDASEALSGRPEASVDGGEAKVDVVEATSLAAKREWTPEKRRQHALSGSSLSFPPGRGPADV